MYAVTSIPLVSRTRATFRSAEFGFLGVVVYTRVHTPRFCGDPRSAGAPVFVFSRRRPWRTSWFNVGTLNLLEARSRAVRPVANPTRSQVAARRDHGIAPRGDLPASRPGDGERLCTLPKGRERD